MASAVRRFGGFFEMVEPGEGFMQLVDTLAEAHHFFLELVHLRLEQIVGLRWPGAGFALGTARAPMAPRTCLSAMIGNPLPHCCAQSRSKTPQTTGQYRTIGRGR